MGRMSQPLRILSLPLPSTLYARFSARLRPCDVDLETVDAILALFGVRLANPVRNLPAGRRNTNVVVETNTGKKMLKGYRAQWNTNTVRYTHSILEELAKSNFPAPRLNQAANGESFVEWTDTHYALFNFEAGTNYSGRLLLRDHRRQLMEIAGETLARLHRELNGFMPQGRHHMGFAGYASPRWRDFAWHVEKVAELKKKSEQLSDAEEITAARWLCDYSRTILDEMARLESVLEEADLPRLIIHGDYGLHNLLFQKDGSAIPVDFELARLEWRLSDLVSCLSRFRYGKAKEIAYDLESIKWFLDGYRAAFPIGGDEWRFWPQVWAFYRLQSAVQYWNSFFETNGPVRKLYSARDAIDQVGWALSHPTLLLSLNNGAKTFHLAPRREGVSA
jgi:Ser/Thr protein kinase RdoA (MazF antagonist)